MSLSRELEADGVGEAQVLQSDGGSSGKIQRDMYIYIYIYTHIHVHIHMCVCVSLSLSLYMCIYIYIHT